MASVAILFFAPTRVIGFSSAAMPAAGITVEVMSKWYRCDLESPPASSDPMLYQGQAVCYRGIILHYLPLSHRARVVRAQ
jgi:hypothetical protein